MDTFHFQWNFASLQHPTFPCSLNASCPEKKEEESLMFAIFLRFALNVLADSIAVSKFVNIGLGII